MIAVADRKVNRLSKNAANDRTLRYRVGNRVRFYIFERAQSAISFSDADDENLFPSATVAPLQEGASSAEVLPIPLPPEVAKGITFLPVRSQLSRNVLTIVGATYHHIGNPTKITS